MTVLNTPGNPEFAEMRAFEEMRALLFNEGDAYMTFIRAFVRGPYLAEQYGSDDSESEDEYGSESEHDESTNEETLELGGTSTTTREPANVPDETVDISDEITENQNEETYSGAPVPDQFEGQSILTLECFVPLTGETFRMGVQSGWTLEECKEEVSNLKQRRVERFCSLDNISLDTSMKVGKLIPVLGIGIPVTIVYHPIEAEVLRSVKFQSVSEDEPFEMDVNLNWTWDILSSELSRHHQKSQVETIFLGNDIISDVKSLMGWENKSEVVTLCFRE